MVDLFNASCMNHGTTEYNFSVDSRNHTPNASVYVMKYWNAQECLKYAAYWQSKWNNAEW